MAFVNLPPNLQDIFYSITDRIAKLETGPNQAMYYAESAQTASAQALQEASAANAQGVQALQEANIAIAQGTQAIIDANNALVQAQSSYALSSQAIIKNAYTIVNGSNQLTAIAGNGITVYSGASSTSGARVVMNSLGLAGYDSSNNATFSILASNGAVSTTGAIFTNSSISGGSLNINGNCIINSSGYLTATGATITGVITATSGTFTGTVYASAGTFTGTITSSNATITGGSLTVGANFQVNTSGVLTASSANVTGTITTSNLTATGGTIGGWSISSTKLYTGAVGSENQYLSSSGGGLLTGAYTIGSVGTVGAITAGTTITAGTKFQTITSSGSFESTWSAVGRAVTGNGWTPMTDNSLQLGSASYRWTTVYAVTPSINTSDARLKTNIQNSELGLNFIKSLRPVSYKWISGQEIPILDKEGKMIEIGKDANGESIFKTKSRPGERIHYGFLGQEVKQAIDNLGVKDFAGWTLDDKNNPDSKQGLRYSEFIAPMVKAIQELSNRLDKVEGK